MGLEHAVSPSQSLAYVLLCIFLVLFGGLMSGLTLGLMSLTAVELEARPRVFATLPLREKLGDGLG